MVFVMVGNSTKPSLALRRLSPRDIIARSYPGWDYNTADRVLDWLSECGYSIVESGADLSPPGNGATDPVRQDT